MGYEKEPRRCDGCGSAERPVKITTVPDGIPQRQFLCRKCELEAKLRVVNAILARSDTCPACGGSGTRTVERTYKGRESWGRTYKTEHRTIICEKCQGDGRVPKAVSA